jgi:hypothetical protein
VPAELIRPDTFFLEFKWGEGQRVFPHQNPFCVGRGHFPQRDHFFWNRDKPGGRRESVDFRPINWPDISKLGLSSGPDRYQRFKEMGGRRKIRFGDRLFILFQNSNSAFLVAVFFALVIDMNWDRIEKTELPRVVI